MVIAWSLPLVPGVWSVYYYVCDQKIMSLSLFTALLLGDRHEIVLHSLVENFLFFEGLQKGGYSIIIIIVMTVPFYN